MMYLLCIAAIVVFLFLTYCAVILGYELWKDSELRKDMLKQRSKKKDEAHGWFCEGLDTEKKKIRSWNRRCARCLQLRHLPMVNGWTRRRMRLND